LIGFVVNPIAGMGGRVALKGTDGVVDEAIERGAQPVSPLVAEKFLKALKSRPKFLTASGSMGEDFLSDFEHRGVHHAGESTSAEDTREAVRRMVEEGAELIVFVGGDGTARDVASVPESRYWAYRQVSRCTPHASHTHPRMPRA